MTDILEAALAYHTQGLVVVPLDRGIKKPSHNDWQKEGTQTEARVRELFTNRDGNIGVACGPASRLLVFDLDPVDKRTGQPKPAFETLAAWEARHGKLPSTFMTGSPSGGQHRWYRTDGRTIYVPMDLVGPTANGVDVLYRRRQIVVPPSVLIGAVGAKGRPQIPGSYTVLNDAQIADCPDWLYALIEQQKSDAPSLDRLNVAWVPVSKDDPTYARRVAYQRHAFSKEPLYLEGEDGLGVMRYVRLLQDLGPGLLLDAETTIENFAEYYDTRLPAEHRWLPNCADELVQDPLRRAYRLASSTGAQPDYTWKIFGQFHDREVAASAPLVPEPEVKPSPTREIPSDPAPAARRFVVRSAADIAKPVPPVEYLLRHFGIAKGRPTLLAGYGGGGKTILAQCLLLHMAAGRPSCFGLPIASGGVLHLDYEMTDDPLDRRYQRLAFAYGIDLAASNLELISMPDIYLSDKDAEVALIEVCAGKMLTVIDNLAAATATALTKENEAAHRRYLDLLTRVSKKTGCAFLVLVHERKASKDEPASTLQRVRGNSALTDAAGAVVSISAAEGDGVITMTQSKASYRKPGDEVVLKIEDVDYPPGMLPLRPPTMDDDPPGLKVENIAELPVSAESKATQARIVAELAKGPIANKALIHTALRKKKNTLNAEIDALVVRREIAFVKGVGYTVDSPAQREARIAEAIKGVGGPRTPGQLAKASCVDESVVTELVAAGRLYRSAGTGFVLVDSVRDPNPSG